MLQSALVLLSLEWRHLVHAVLNRLDDLPLLFLGGEQLIWEEPLRAGDVCQWPGLLFHQLFLRCCHDLRLVDDFECGMAGLELPADYLYCCQRPESSTTTMIKGILTVIE